MGLFDFLKPKIDLSNKLNDFEKQSSVELIYIIKGIRQHLETQFCSEYDPEPIDIYKYYEGYSNEKFQKLVQLSLRNGYFYDSKGEFLNFEDGLKSLTEKLFSYALTRARQKQLGNELDILIKGTNSERERLFLVAEKRKILSSNLLIYCTSKEIILNEMINENETENYILFIIIEAVKNLIKNGKNN
jgi:hypothetical protein